MWYKLYKIELSLNFDFENIDKCDYAEIISTLEETFKHGTIKTNNRISDLKIKALE